MYGHRLSGDDEGYLEGLHPRDFADQMEYLARYYEIIPLAELVACFEERRPVPERSVVLTFDDGFRDNRDVALAVLERLRAPATVFVVTGCISSGELPWSQRLGYVFQRTERTAARIDLLGPDPVDLGDDRRRRSAYLAVKGRLRSVAQPERDAVVASIADRLGVDPPRDRMLSWRDLEEMRGCGVEIGAHTYSHPYLGEIPHADAVAEMGHSREDLRERLGIEQPPFCFPAGSWTPELVREVPRLGFRSVFLKTSHHRVNSLDTTHQYALHRVGLPNASARVLEAELDGPMPALRHLYRTVTRGDRDDAGATC